MYEQARSAARTTREIRFMEKRIGEMRLLSRQDAEKHG